MEIRKFNDSDFDVFTLMVGVCFVEDYKIALANIPLIGLCEDMVQKAKAGIIFIDILHLDNTPIGFIEYQVDSPESDWYEKEGCGCIREMYIQKEHRGRGYGKFLAVHAGDELRKLGVPYIYLTADDAIDFWLSAGYTDTGEICDKNGGKILIK
ncbi:MAG: GNAT family N-acetyltransferase [Defluviitaleaceae bacterium]|nr:GNAT family N-acetyltransferase [Defluviitaleaceae bacterium]